MNTRLVRITKIMLDLSFYIGILLTLSIPFLFQIFGNYIASFRDFYLQQCLLFFLSGVMLLMIVWELRRMFTTVLHDDAFVMENAVSLKHMGKCSFVIALMTLLRLPITPTPATIVVMITFAVAGLFSIVLCQVFEKAVQYKLTLPWPIFRF